MSVSQYVERVGPGNIFKLHLIPHQYPSISVNTLYYVYVILNFKGNSQNNFLNIFSNIDSTFHKIINEEIHFNEK